jgi:pimeloyl-ACP methyl ester carboxylesterase
MPFADVNGQHLYFEDTGGTEPPVIFCHGFLLDGSMFEYQVNALENEFRCITWDERGFGQTGAATAPFTYWDSADDALALLTHLDIEKAFFVGMSQGGFISLRAALRAPDRVLGLGLIDTQAGPENPDVLPAYEGLANEWVTNGPSNDLAETIASIIMSPGYDHSGWITKWQAAPKENLALPFQTLAGRDDVTSRLGEIACPAIVFHGENDAAIPMEKAEVLSKELPNCEELVRVEGAGHASNLSHPGDVNRPLRDFLERHSGAR